jgi:arylsulfatase
VTADYADRGTFPFTGGTIHKVIVDVSGECYIDHEAQVLAWFAID